MIVVPAPGGKSEVVWIADLLPNEMAPAITGMIEQGLAAMRGTLESGNRPDDDTASSMPG